MPVSEKHISQVKRAAALRKFQRKVEVLEAIVGTPAADAYPRSLKARPFIRWESAELGAEAFSPAHFYCKDEENSKLRTRASAALKDLAKQRVRPSRGKPELVEVQRQLKQSKRGQKLAEDELVKVKALLEDATHDNAILRQRLKRKHASFSPTNIVQLPSRLPAVSKE